MKEMNLQLFGGRGASSGISEKGNEYGSQYHEVLSEGNIKFISKNSRTSEDLMETMTKGRVYVTVGGNDLLKLTYFDTEEKRNRTIDLNHVHQGEKPHGHTGYWHNENDGEKGFSKLTTKEKKMLNRVQRIWYNYINRR